MTDNKENKELTKQNLRLDILKHIRDSKLLDISSAETRMANMTKRAKLEKLIEDKKESELGERSIEELEKELKDLE